MPPYTKGFKSAYILTLHFTKHGALLGVNTEAEYLAMADEFLGAPLIAGVAECNRQTDNNLLRFCQAEQKFGVLQTDRFIRTFYRFDPPLRNGAWFKKRCAA